MFNYGGWRKTCDTLFVIFAAVFLITRLVVFPCRLEFLHLHVSYRCEWCIYIQIDFKSNTFRVVYTTAVDWLDVFPPFPGYYFFNFLLLVLQALHIFWAWLILRMVYKFVFLGKVSLAKSIFQNRSGFELKRPNLFLRLNETNGATKRARWRKMMEEKRNTAGRKNKGP